MHASLGLDRLSNVSSKAGIHFPRAWSFIAFSEDIDILIGNPSMDSKVDYQINHEKPQQLNRGVSS